MAIDFRDGNFNMDVDVGGRPTPDFSVMAWFRAYSGGTFQGVWNHAGSFPIAGNLQINTSDEMSLFLRDAEEDILSASTTSTWVDGDWHVVLARHFNGQDVDLWIDWSLKDSSTNTAYDPSDGTLTRHEWGSAVGEGFVFHRCIEVFRKITIPEARAMMLKGKVLPVRGIWHEFEHGGVQNCLLGSGVHAVPTGGTNTGFVAERPPVPQPVE